MRCGLILDVRSLLTQDYETETRVSQNCERSMITEGHCFKSYFGFNYLRTLLGMHYYCMHFFRSVKRQR